MFILSAERHDPMGSWWDNYQAYLNDNGAHFPSSAFELATSDWFHGAGNKAPHDAWLQAATVQERNHLDRSQLSATTITIDLLGAHHDGEIALTYENVRSYQLGSFSVDGGLRDWRYDEFTLVEPGVFRHEIEWWGPSETGRWIIEARDITHRWRPFSDG